MLASGKLRDKWKHIAGGCAGGYSDRQHPIWFSRFSEDSIRVS